MIGGFCFATNNILIGNLVILIFLTLLLGLSLLTYRQIISRLSSQTKATQKELKTIQRNNKNIESKLKKLELSLNKQGTQRIINKKPVSDHPEIFRIDGRETVTARSDQGAKLTELATFLKTPWLILHISEGRETLHHVDAWHSYCALADKSVLLVLRSRPLFECVAAERPHLTAVYVRNGRQAEWLIQRSPNATTVLYVSNTGNTVHFVRFPHLRHIFIGHGDSEKISSCGKQFRCYDEVWTAGQAHIDRFSNTNIDFSSLRFRIVGRPQVRFLLEASSIEHKKYFLYLPTWEGYHQEQNYSSISIIGQSLQQIANLVKISGLIKLHPSTGIRIPSLLGISNSAFNDKKTVDDIILSDQDSTLCAQVEKNESAIKLMRDAAFLISDISSVVSDFLVTGRPIFLYLPEAIKSNKFQTAHSATPLSEYCYIFSTPHELLKQIKEVILNKNDVLKQVRVKSRNYFIDIQATQNMHFIKELKIQQKAR